MKTSRNRQLQRQRQKTMQDDEFLDALEEAMEKLSEIQEKEMRE